jgi:general secretion pathway protein A
MLLRYFGLSEDPFGVTPEPRFLYHSHTHREALASLKYGFQSNRGFTALIAPPGLGKTTLLYRYLSDIQESARIVFLFDIDSQSEPRELIGAILRDLGVTPANTSTGMHEQMNAVLVEEARRGRVVVVVIDEAQNLSHAALETLRLLSNFETTQAKLIHIVLAGQPQLSETLMEPSLVQLRQRITTVCKIELLSDGETRDYIDHRLRRAGHSGEPLFTSDALDLIVKASQGIPRTINNLCFNALSICRALNGKQVSAGMVEEAVMDLDLVPPCKEVPAVPAQPSPFPLQPRQVASLARRWAFITTALLIVSVLGVLGFSRVRLLPTHAAVADHSIDSKAPSTPVSTNDEKKSDLPHIAPSVERFRVIVGRHQTLRDISMQYLGEFNSQCLHQIRELNPKLTNPNHIVPGQSIWLPGPPASNVAESAGTSTDTRSLQ